MTNFNERTNTLLYKNIPLTLYSKRLMLVVCERWVGDGDRLLHIDPKFFWPLQHFFRILAGLLNRGSLRAQAICLELVLTSLASNLQLQLELTDWPKPSVAPGYIIVWHPPASCERTHLPASPNSTTSTGQGDTSISSTGCTCFAVLPLIYTGASLDWRFGRESICYSSILFLIFSKFRIPI